MAATFLSRRLPTLLWLLHVPLACGALAALVSFRYDLWIDLRQMGVLAAPLCIAWSIATVLFPLLAGPLPTWRKGAWRAGLIRLPQWLRYALLAPTAILLVPLVLNSIWFYQLYFADQTNFFPVPSSLLALLILVPWLLLSVAWLSVAQASRLCPVPWASRPCSGDAATIPPTAPGPFRTILLLLFAPLPALWLFFFQFANPAPPPQQPLDLAVVLGNATLPDGTCSPLLRDRTRAAIDLYHQGRVRYLMLSGSVDDQPTGRVSEAGAMAKECLAQGVPAAALILDPLGVNTRATALNTQREMQRRGLHTVVGVSDNFHLQRIRYAFADVGLDACTYPARRDVWIQADIAAGVRETVALIVYRFHPQYRAKELQAMTVAQPRIRVSKSAGSLELFDGDRLVKTYRCITGKNPGTKEREGDYRTPEGAFYICYKNPESNYHLSLGLNYPTIADARRGVAAGMLTQEQHDRIVEANTTCGIPDWYTPLGGEIMIHGCAEGRSSTAGCIAVSNPEIEELYAICPLNTPVEIAP